MINFNDLDIQGAYREVSIDRDCCMQGMRQAEETFPEGSVERDRSYSYWLKRYKRMKSVLTSIRTLIERDNQALHHLSNEQLEIFHMTYNRHQMCMGTEMRKKYSRDQLKNVVWDNNEECLKVYYKNGDWLHYTRKYEWY